MKLCAETSVLFIVETWSESSALIVKIKTNAQQCLLYFGFQSIVISDFIKKTCLLRYQKNLACFFITSGYPKPLGPQTPMWIFFSRTPLLCRIHFSVKPTRKYNTNPKMNNAKSDLRTVMFIDNTDIIIVMDEVAFYCTIDQFATRKLVRQTLRQGSQTQIALRAKWGLIKQP